MKEERSMSLLKRLLLALVVGPIAMLAVAELDIALADSREDGALTETLTLHPGNNFVGWVAEPIAVEDIFHAIPATSLIYRWDADTRHWQYAIREVGGNLETLDSGMAATIRIEGQQSVEWERPLTPARGSVTLYSGVNWVAWNGRDKWPLDQVARGLGKSLVSIEVQGLVYTPNSGVSDVDAPRSGDSTIRRGDAVRVTVSRDLSWLQPTGMMPKIVWAGDPPQSLKDTITADIGRVVDFFAETFAVESDFSETTVLLFHSIDAAVEHHESGAEPRLNHFSGSLRSVLQHRSQAAAQPWGFWMTTCAWQSPSPQPCLHWSIETLTHEWLHVLQYQLSAVEAWRASPQWMLEGAAMWVEWLLSSEWRAIPFEHDRELKIDQAARTSVRLQEVEEWNGWWQHQIGLLAAERLAALSGADAHIEYTRQLHPQVTGKERRWVQTPTWQAAFEVAFGLTKSEFYGTFAAWRQTLPTPARRYDYFRNDVKLSGTLRARDGSPAAGFRINAAPYLGDTQVSTERGTIVDEEGAFSIDVAPETMQRIWLTRDACTLWLTDDGLTTSRPQPGLYRDLDTRNLPMLNLTLPLGACQNELRAWVTRLRGDQRRLQVLLIDNENYDWTSSTLSRSGAFTAYALEPGAYRVHIRLDDCELYYTKEGLAASWQDGDVLELGRQPVSIEFRIPDSLCLRRIGGQILDEDGAAIGGAWLEVRYGGLSSSGAAFTDGRFNMEVPDTGDYLISLWTGIDGCNIYYSASGGTADWRQATPITVADQDVTGIEFRVPKNLADLCR